MSEERQSYVVKGVREIVGAGIEAAKVTYRLMFDPAFYKVSPDRKDYRESWETPARRMVIDFIAMVATGVFMPSVEHGITLSPLHVLVALELGLMASYMGDLALTGVAILGARGSEN